MSNLPDDYFRRFTPADLITEVARITLAVISANNPGELIRIGWLDNPIVDKLYKLGSTGVWVGNEINAGGQIETKSKAQMQITLPLIPPTIGDIPNPEDHTAMSTAKLTYLHRKILIVPITTSGAGAAADQVLVPAIGGYRGCMRMLGIVSSITEAATVIDFEDEDNTDLLGNLTGGFSLNFTAATINTQLTGIIMTGTAAGKALECDITLHAAGGIIIIYFEYWYEP